MPPAATKGQGTNNQHLLTLYRVLTALLDTPQMQRLRDIKQLGTAEHVYMNVNHNRFEHSLGVSYLAERMCQRIRTNQPSLLCTAKDVLCVQLAGLLHDIGHGPFSHAFEDFVHTQMDRIRDDPTLAAIYEKDSQYSLWPPHEERWSHEEASLMMIDAALEHLGLAIDPDRLDEPLKQIGDGVAASSMRAFDSNQDGELSILTSRDFIFIKECIVGGPVKEYEHTFGKGKYLGRTHDYQTWLYDIVSNRHSGLDVDKVDYFARDQRRALRDSGEIDKVMVDEAVVAKVKRTAEEEKWFRDSTATEQKLDGHLMLVYPQKLVGPAMNFFKTRFTLHSKSTYGNEAAHLKNLLHSIHT
jgi:deoxynucleoside triphosphate triphosphohydrolase SAMHD1